MRWRTGVEADRRILISGFVPTESERRISCDLGLRSLAT